MLNSAIFESKLQEPHWWVAAICAVALHQVYESVEDVFSRNIENEIRVEFFTLI
jgi:hypothetical protein